MTIEDCFLRIGQLALEELADLQGKVLVAAEVQPGVIESAIFYERGLAKVVTYRYCSDALEDCLYDLWEQWNAAGNAVWFGIEYAVENGRFQIGYAYPNQINFDQGAIERRPELLQKHFSTAAVDCSMPDG